MNIGYHAAYDKCDTHSSSLYLNKMRDRLYLDERKQDILMFTKRCAKGALIGPAAVCLPFEMSNRCEMMVPGGFASKCSYDGLENKWE